MAVSAPRARWLLAPLVAAALAAATHPPAVAQSDGNPAVRGANLARMQAEKLNGGLGAYRAAPCMHEQAGGACQVGRTGQGITFRFLGGAPGWSQLGLPPTVETEILVAPDGRSIVAVVYNGPPRQPVRPQ
jgi:hypothetical protein